MIQIMKLRTNVRNKEIPSQQVMRSYRSLDRAVEFEMISRKS